MVLFHIVSTPAFFSLHVDIRWKKHKDRERNYIVRDLDKQRWTRNKFFFSFEGIAAGSSSAFLLKLSRLAFVDPPFPPNRTASKKSFATCDTPPNAPFLSHSLFLFHSFILSLPCACVCVSFHFFPLHPREAVSFTSSISFIERWFSLQTVPVLIIVVFVHC